MFLLKIYGHLLRCFKKNNPRRAKSTPAGVFFLRLESAPPIFKTADTTQPQRYKERSRGMAGVKPHESHSAPVLCFPKPRIVPIFFQKFIVFSFFDKTAFLKDKNLICLLNSP